MSALYTHAIARRALLWALVLGLPACTDPFTPDVVKSPPSLLVIDGFLNAQGVTTIRLSRTYAVDSKAVLPVETRATVYMEDQAGARLPLFESSVRGTYTSAAQTLSTAGKYRLHLVTLSGKEYVSEYVPVKLTPPIDALTWKTNSDGLNVLVSAHDATNNTQYYRWETDETWEITPPYFPNLEYAAGNIRSIVVPFPLVCYGNQRASTVHLNKTTALTQDVVSEFRVRQLLTSTDRLFTRYSLLVQQHALTKEEYAYWELLRKNTESLGSLFDPQPVQLTGNVRCLNNPADLALGFVGAHSLTEKRLFIRRAELPGSWPIVSGYQACLPPDTVFVPARTLGPSPSRADILAGAFGQGSGYLPITEVYIMGAAAGYLAKTRDCIDCRTRGSAVKPSFWP